MSTQKARSSSDTPHYSTCCANLQMRPALKLGQHAASALDILTNIGYYIDNSERIFRRMT